MLSVRDIEEYFFCPMVFYFSVVLGQERFKGYWADLGKDLQKDVEKVIVERFDVVAKEFRVESERLRVRGKIDFVVKDDDRLAPLEVKYSHSLKPWWKYSAILYAILLEDSTDKPVKRCYVFLTESDKIKAVKVTDENRNFVESSVRKCYEILGGKTPKPSKSRSCRNCDFKYICKDFS